MPFLSETTQVKERTQIPEEKLMYFRARLSTRIHALILNRFRALEDKFGYKKSDLAHRINKDAALITRWLSGPGNLELSSVSDLLLAMGLEPWLDYQELQEGAIAPSKEAWLVPRVKVEEPKQKEEAPLTMP